MKIFPPRAPLGSQARLHYSSPQTIHVRSRQVTGPQGTKRPGDLPLDVLCTASPGRRGQLGILDGECSFSLLLFGTGLETAFGTAAQEHESYDRHLFFEMIIRSHCGSRVRRGPGLFGLAVKIQDHVLRGVSGSQKEISIPILLPRGTVVSTF